MHYTAFQKSLFSEFIQQALSLQTLSHPPGNGGKWVAETEHHAHCSAHKAGLEGNKGRRTSADKQQVENHLADNEKEQENAFSRREDIWNWRWNPGGTIKPGRGKETECLNSTLKSLVWKKCKISSLLLLKMKRAATGKINGSQFCCRHLTTVPAQAQPNIGLHWSCFTSRVSFLKVKWQSISFGYGVSTSLSVHTL